MPILMNTYESDQRTGYTCEASIDNRPMAFTFHHWKPAVIGFPKQFSQWVSFMRPDRPRARFSLKRWLSQRGRNQVTPSGSQENADFLTLDLSALLKYGEESFAPVLAAAARAIDELNEQSELPRRVLLFSQEACPEAVRRELEDFHNSPRNLGVAVGVLVPSLQLKPGL